MFITKKRLEKMLEDERIKEQERGHLEKANIDLWNNFYRMRDELNERLTALEYATGIKKEPCRCENCRTAEPKRC